MCQCYSPQQPVPVEDRALCTMGWGRAMAISQGWLLARGAVLDRSCGAHSLPKAQKEPAYEFAAFLSKILNNLLNYIE